MERSRVARSDHDHVGNRRGVDGLHAFGDSVLLAAPRPRRGGSGLLPGDHRLSDALVPLSGSSESRGVVHGRGAAVEFSWRAGFGFAAWGELVRNGRLEE